MLVDAKSPSDALEAQQPKAKLSHVFKLGKIWQRLTEVCVSKNATQTIEVHSINRLKKQPVNVRNMEKMQKLDLAKAWTEMQNLATDDSIMFGTHMQLDNEDAIESLIRKLEPWYKLGNEYDLQRFYGFKINGINEVQFFFKADGAWTPLHVEDCGLATFNVNIGPGTSHWTLIHADDTPRLSAILSKALKLKKPIDIWK